MFLHISFIQQIFNISFFHTLTDPVLYLVKVVGLPRIYKKGLLLWNKGGDLY